MDSRISAAPASGETGIDGVIIPDFVKDYMEEYRSIAEEQDVRIIMLITPETSE